MSLQYESSIRVFNISIIHILFSFEILYSYFPTRNNVIKVFHISIHLVKLKTL